MEVEDLVRGEMLKEPRRSLEELSLRHDAYYPGNLHLVSLGSLYADRYFVIRKLGYGMCSTVWLVVGVHSQFHYALKVLSAQCYGSVNDTFESEILLRLKECRDQHGGRYTSQLVDYFGFWGNNGYHVCYVLEIMAENLHQFGNFCRDNMDGDWTPVPCTVLKRFVKQILTGLDYAHGLGIIHNGLFLARR